MSACIRHQCDSHDSDINVHNHTGGVDTSNRPPPLARRQSRIGIIRENDDDAIGHARSAMWDGALLVTRDDVFKRFDDETRRTTIDADAELAEIFARDSTSTSTATATARDGALDAFDAFDSVRRRRFPPRVDSRAS